MWIQMLSGCCGCCCFHNAQALPDALYFGDTQKISTELMELDALFFSWCRWKVYFLSCVSPLWNPLAYQFLPLLFIVSSFFRQKLELHAWSLEASMEYQVRLERDVISPILLNCQSWGWVFKHMANPHGLASWPLTAIFMASPSNVLFTPKPRAADFCRENPEQVLIFHTYDEVKKSKC